MDKHSTTSVRISGPGLPYLARLIGTDEQSAAALIANTLDERKSREEAAIDEQIKTR